MITVRNLTYRIKTKTILDDLNFQITDREKIAVIGPNGSGKTTLLKHLYKDISVLSGEILIDNVNINNIKRGEYSKKSAVVTQENYINYNGFSVEDIVLMGRYPYKGFFSDYDNNDKNIVAECLEKVGMADKRKREFLSLSGGEKQRVLIARAFSQESEILVLDEPVNHLDIKHQIELMKILKRTAKTVIMSLHNIEAAANWCDKIILLKNGRLADFGKPQNVITEKNIKDVFEVDSKITVTGQKIEINYLAEFI